MSYNKLLITRVGLSALIFVPVFVLSIVLKEFNFYVELSLCLLAYLIVGYDVLGRAIRNIAHGQIFDENFLMVLATIGAFITLEFEEAVMVMLLYQLGEWFQSYAVNKSRKSISELVAIRPDYANLLEGDRVSVVEPEKVQVGDLILVKPGEKIPLDGVIVEGSSSLDTSSLTGESVWKDVKETEEVLSGTINQTGILKIRVTHNFAESTVSKILELVENASSKKSSTENFITKFARYYTPIVVILAVLLAVIPPLFFHQDWLDYIYRACSFLVISCPCALVISVPMSFFGGIGGASRIGILIKGSNYIEQLSKVKKVAFDKTGTLTKGNFKVAKIAGQNPELLLEYAAYGEAYSHHPLAQAIMQEYGKTIDYSLISDYQEYAGEGITYSGFGGTVAVGNQTLMARFGVEIEQLELVGTIVYVAVNGILAGYLLIVDEIKPEAKSLIADLKELGITETIMLSGDSDKVAKMVGDSLGISKVYSQLLPQDKVRVLEENLDSRYKLAYVGDGINDAPVLMRSDVGIAMGGLGSDAAIEASDIVIMDDDISKISSAIRISHKTLGIVYANIIFALGVKFAVLILGALSLASLWLAIFADVGVAFICILNAMRALSTKKLGKKG